MKRIVTLLSAALVAGLFSVGCNNTTTNTTTDAKADTTAVAGSIVYFNIDKVVENYDMANDLRSVVETKVNGIQSEIDRRGNKLQKDANDFQNKMDKGLLTSSVANAQYQKLQQQQNEYQQYAVRKQQEMQEEQQVMLNQIMNAIAEFVQAQGGRDEVSSGPDEGRHTVQFLSPPGRHFPVQREYARGTGKVARCQGLLLQTAVP